MSVSADYLVKESLPEYSLALHLDVDRTARTVSCSLDVLKGTEDETGYLAVRKAADTDKHIDTVLERVGCAQNGKDLKCIIF